MGKRKSGREWERRREGVGDRKGGSGREEEREGVGGNSEGREWEGGIKRCREKREVSESNERWKGVMRRRAGGRQWEEDRKRVGEVWEEGRG